MANTTHPGFPKRIDVAADQKVVYSDHLPIITEQIIDKNNKLRIVSFNTMGAGASKLSGFTYEETEDQAKERHKRNLELIQKIRDKQAPDVFMFQETNIDLEALKQTLDENSEENWVVKTHEDSNIITCYKTSALSELEPEWDEPNKIFTLNVRHTATEKTIALHNVWGNFTHYPHVQEAVFETKLTQSIANGANIAVILGDTNSRLAPTDTRERNLTTGIIPTKYVNLDPVLGPILHQHFKDTNDFLLLEVDEEVNLLDPEKPYSQDENERRPTLIKKGDEYFMYGNAHGNVWTVTKLAYTQPFAELGETFNQLKINQLEPLDKNQLTLEMCKAIINGDGASIPQPGHAPTLLFPDMPDGAFSLTDKKGASIVQLTKSILDTEGKRFIFQPEAVEAGSIEEKLLSADYKAVMCLDPYYKKTRLIANETIFDYEKKIRHLAGNPNIYVRSTANYMNQRGIVITFNEKSNFYEKIKDALEPKNPKQDDMSDILLIDEDAVEAAEAPEQAHKCQFVSRQCPVTLHKHKSIFVPMDSVRLLHNTMVGIMNSPKFSEFRKTRNTIVTRINKQINKISSSIAITSDAQYIRAAKVNSLEKLREKILNVPLDNVKTCSVMYTEKTPDYRFVEYLITTDTGYIRTPDALYFVDKTAKGEGKCVLVAGENAYELVAFDDYLKNNNIDISTPKIETQLNENQSKHITEAIGFPFFFHSALGAPAQYKQLIDEWKNEDSILTKPEESNDDNEAEARIRVKNSELMEVHRGLFGALAAKESQKPTNCQKTLAKIETEDLAMVRFQM